MATDDQLDEMLARMLDEDAPAAPPPDRLLALRERAEEAQRQRAASSAPVVPAPTTAPPNTSIGDSGHELASRRRSRAPWLAVAASVVAFAVGLGVARMPDRTGDDQVAGEVEYLGAMNGPDDALADVELTVTATGTGRMIELRTDVLPILPVGEFYQVWFVARGDEPHAPDRISAGTFHPDVHGRSDVEFSAAVDPDRYPIVEITAEPGDGNPMPTGPVVLSADIPES